MPVSTESCSEQVVMIYHDHDHQSGAASVESSAAAAVAFFSLSIWSVSKVRKKEKK